MREKIALILLLVETITLLYLAVLPYGISFIEPVGIRYLRPSDIEHTIAFAVWGVLFVLTFNNSIPNKRNLYLLGIIGAALLGIWCETLQFFIPTRWADLFDVYFDGLGGFLGVGVFYVVKRYKYFKNK